MRAAKQVSRPGVLVKTAAVHPVGSPHLWLAWVVSQSLRPPGPVSPQVTVSLAIAEFGSLRAALPMSVLPLITP